MSQVPLTIPDELANKARADGLHDFDKGLAPTSTDPGRNGVFAGSVTGSSAYDWDEDTVMDVTFLRKDARKIWDTLRDGETAPQQYYVYSQQGNPEAKPYTIKRVVLEGKDGPTLVQALGINGAVLQVDFNHHGFLGRLKTGPSRPDLQVGYVWSAATVNDPASKTPPNDPIFEPGGEGVTLVAHVQTSGATLFPGGKTFDPKNPAQNFVSAYDVELSEIKTKTSLGRRSKSSVNIKFTKGQQSAVVSDSKGQNSPAQLNSFISKLLTKLTDLRARFDLSTKWQQKRSGDWLQALHAALLKTMTFNPPLPPGAVPFFVSHDRIAIAYALEMGLNCLYFTGDSVIAFNSTPETEEVKAARCNAALARLNTADLGAFATQLYANRNVSLGVFRTECTTAIEGLRTGLTGSSLSLGTLESGIRTILTSALKYAHIEALYPDQETLGRDLVSTDVCVRYGAYAKLELLKLQHTGEPGVPRAIHKQFENTLLYKSAATWTIEPSLMSRLTTFGRGEGTDKRDAYLFYPFLQNSKNAELKESIAGVFREIQAKITPASPDPAETARVSSTLLAWGARTATRQQRVVTGLNNLLGQAYLFLKTTQVPDSGMGADAAAFAVTVSGPEVLPAEPANPVAGEATKPPFINQMWKAPVLESKEHDQEEDDVPLPEAAEGVEMVGGWSQGGRPITSIGIDSDQCTDPILYAYIDYSAYGLRSLALKDVMELEDTMRFRRLQLLADDVDDDETTTGGSKRRPLYRGGQTQTMTVTQVGPPSDQITPEAADVIQMSLLLVIDRLIRNLLKLRKDPPPHLLADYSRVVHLVSGLLMLPATPVNALAVRDLCSHAVFLTDKDIGDVFSIDLYSARVLRLFFSAFEEYQLLDRPTNPAEFLRKAASVLAPLYSKDQTPQSVAALQDQVQTLKKTILDRYGVTVKVFPGQGQVLAPGVKNPQTPEELRAARLRTFRAGSRKPLYRRTYRRPRTSTTP
jgi:hypothetical protein